eukprot:3254108-Pyramimonas_sp.AAC.1
MFEGTHNLFIDGSVMHPQEHDIARGGWAVVEVTAMGELIGGIRGPLPRELPQSAVMAEHVGLLASV